MQYPNEPVFPHYPKPELPQVLPAHGVSWQRWFWRGWGWITLANTAITMTLGGMEGLLFFGVLGLLVGVVLGFWVSVFSTIGLYQREFERQPAFWFAVHYTAWAAIVVLIFYLLTSAWNIWSFDTDHFLILSVELPMAFFMLASGLVGWHMHGWLNRQQLAAAEVPPPPKS
ncbi:hypothetical protein [Herpetosiphon giganteus]|uniref:hypothetical protein n=1 Tax=Herpetosiphon giganteus TaxID=2029754 RepID=UPI00195BD242|nr:hypothetical protein [Herpetosiphon giganteus]MBM7842937.1 hypothetical protein [Herpetosiphon giganteus]